ncbi:MAG: mannose-1-phosphate guanylyltransferase [Thermoanaerobaculia bacterium]|nr:mannose-1-phosphate guanylyltransferase [Thermoanaerobaculia bacterium]
MQNSANTFVAIMAGGVGSRFWPGSREARPKQFLDMLGVGKSLLRLTFERFLPFCPASNIYIVTNAAYRNLVKQQLPELSDSQILGEPSRNNTGPCIAYTAFKLAGLNPDANMVVAPSDHIVLKEDIFRQKIGQALDFAARHDALVTLGITPSRPDTGYGYIQFKNAAESGIYKVERFTEKPKLADAQAFVASGEYVWNAGIFIWKVKNVLKAFETHSPDIFHILEKGESLYNTPREEAFIREQYPTTPNISVDFAIMEKAPNVYTIPADFGWSDLGTWASLHHECPKDEQGNVFQADHIVAMDVQNSLVRAPKGKLVVLKDLDDYIVVDEPDVLLIYPKSKEQEIKQVTVRVKEQFGDIFL